MLVTESCCSVGLQLKVPTPDENKGIVITNKIEVRLYILRSGSYTKITRTG